MNQEDSWKVEVDEGIAALIDDARRGQRIVVDRSGDTAGFQVVALREDEKLHTIDLEQYAPRPRRRKGFIVVRTAQAFVDYVNRHKTPGELLLVADKDAVVAVMNHHEETDGVLGDPGWSDSGCKLQLEYTPAWTGWSGLAGGYITQDSFADFLEENASDVSDPDVGHLLDVVTNLRLASNSKIRRRVNLQNGAVRFEFEEDFVPAGGGDDDLGVIEVPPRITVRLQVFRDGDEFDVPMLLRYRVKDGQIQWMFKFTNQAQKLFDDSFDRMTGFIAAGIDHPVYRGSALW